VKRLSYFSGIAELCVNKLDGLDDQKNKLFESDGRRMSFYFSVWIREF